MTSLALNPTKPVKKHDFKIVETAAGQWKIFEHENGSIYKEYCSDAEIFGLPLISIVHGKNPTTGRMGTARGYLAIGQRASGVVAVGQFCEGYISVGQFAAGRIAAIGQFTVAPLAIGQFSLALLGLSQIGAAGWGLFQVGAVVFGGFGQEVFNIGQSVSGLF